MNEDAEPPQIRISIRYGHRFRCEAFSMYETASGVLQFVSPWSTSTLPMRLAASIAFWRSAGLKIPIGMSAPFIAYRAQFGERWISFSMKPAERARERNHRN